MVVITQNHVFRKGPREGKTEVRNPYKFGDGFYKVFSPEGVMGSDGKRHWNRLENAKRISSLEEVADYIEKGWGVRMIGPLTPSPSLCWKDIEVLR
jgi:hypothetical protein